MDSQNSFLVYHAAAGAGKTYTLVRDYLVTLLKSPFKNGYKNILAITFTNKAVEEMKSRILDTLKMLSDPSIAEKDKFLFKEIKELTGLSQIDLQKKAARVLQSLLHNYAAFDIITIDTFTHRVIRTFAKDLGLPVNFEIEMDLDSLINEAVDALISKIGDDPHITDIVLKFALEKLDDDKSWDISIELKKIAKLLFSENDRDHLIQLEAKTQSDFENLRKKLEAEIAEGKTHLKTISSEVLNKINTALLDFKDFNRGTIPNFFEKIKKGDTQIKFDDAKWKTDLENTALYTSKLAQEKKDSIDALRPEIERAFYQLKEESIGLNKNLNIYKNLTPLSVLKAIQTEINLIKKERHIVLISEFNAIITEAIKDQPAPFIYERLGERYRNYFIDEFQDTSYLQWKNLIPLIDNALATETLEGIKGHLTIVGDAKQAIYRWRGGRAEQFLNLSQDKNPFSTKEKKVLDLPVNYRSAKEIIEFNNAFFTHIAGDFSNQNHASLYIKGNQQKTTDKDGGYVNISFIEASNKEEEHQIYPQEVLSTINKLKEADFDFKDICIITRKRSEGVKVADYLVAYDIPIISTETLLLKNDPRVNFIIAIFQWFLYPDDESAKLSVLYFITDFLNIEEPHKIFESLVHKSFDKFKSFLSLQDIDFSFDKLVNKPLYEATEDIVTAFGLANETPAYIQFFLDTVFSFSQSHQSGVQDFLTYWLQHKDVLSISMPEGEDSVTLMTIHKSKGLEFPIVIYPYVNDDIYNEIDPKTWLKLNPDEYAGFSETLISYSEGIANYSEDAAISVKNRKAQLELDAVNLLYVAFTRAKRQLYIISKLEINQKGEYNRNKFSGKLMDFLSAKKNFDTSVRSYDFGAFSKNNFEKVHDQDYSPLIIDHFNSKSDQKQIVIVTNEGRLWDTKRKEAIEKGNILHDLLAQINTINDVERVVNDSYLKGLYTRKEVPIIKKEINKVVLHPKLKPYFSKNYRSLNERAIYARGEIFRPDRLAILENQVTIIDYKTGEYIKRHEEQLNQYANLLIQMGYDVVNRILVYISEEDISLKYI